MYDAASALMKSLRGSDPDAALHYLARFLEAGDLITPCRRLLCSASEDVGMAYPQAVSIVKACVDTAMQLGLPEAQLPLALERRTELLSELKKIYPAVLLDLEVRG